MKQKRKVDVKGKSRLSDRKKRMLGTFMLLAFIAFISITATKYLIAWDVGLETIAIASLSVSLVLILLMEFRTTMRRRKPRTAKRSKKSNPRKRRKR